MGCGAQTNVRVRRVLGGVLVTILALATAACDPGPPAPAPVPPVGPAPAGTVRAQLEAWVGTYAYPWALGRSASTQDRSVWADRVVRETTAGVGLTIAVAPEALRRAAAPRLRAHLQREPSADELTFWTAWLGTHSVDQLEATVAASGEVAARHPGSAAWLDRLAAVVLGRALTPAERTPRLAALAGGTARATLALELIRVPEARRRVVAQVHGELGLTAPSGTTLALRVSQLDAARGNDRVVRAVLAVDRAPARVRVGVVGDSVGWDLWNRGGGSAMARSILAPVGSAARIACAALSTDPQYQILDQFDPFVRGGTWRPIADGRCPAEVALLEATMLARGPEVVIWQIGAWETWSFRDGSGRVLAPRSAALRDALVGEAVRRIDGWTSRGVRRVLLPEWACNGPEADADHRSPAFTAFIRSVLDAIVAARPAAAIAPTPPQLCVGGDPAGTATREGRIARGQQFHWVDGPSGAEWGYASWFAPAVADLPGLR